MKLLLIDTSGSVGRLGLGNATQLLAEASLDRGQRHARDLMPQCQMLFAQQRWMPGEVDTIAVSIGPGSYTGLRVGVMTAKTLAYALGKPLLAIPTFTIIARHCYDMEPDLGALQVIGDGQQDRVYVQQFTSINEASPLTIEAGESWRAALKAGDTISGPGLVPQQARLPPHVRIVPEDRWHPALEAMRRIAVEQYQANVFVEPFTLEPLYLRVSSAEEQWAARELERPQSSSASV
jgi:tRNA threonylcarbamoyladenosine biosynthesis protein TsaB